VGKDRLNAGVALALANQNLIASEWGGMTAVLLSDHASMQQGAL